MKLMIDGDACPVIKECEFLASKYQIPMLVFCDVNHDIQLEYGSRKRSYRSCFSKQN